MPGLGFGNDEGKGGNVEQGADIDISLIITGKKCRRKTDQSCKRKPTPHSTPFLAVHPTILCWMALFTTVPPCAFRPHAIMMMNKGIFNLELTKSNAIIMFQSAAKFALLCLAIAAANAVSTLTTANCPDNYDLKATNTSESGYSSAAIKAVYGGIYSASDQAVLQQSFSEGNTGTVYGYATSMSILLPFILIAVAFGIAFIVAICCCVFEKTCPPCASWKRDFTKNPYDKVELKCTSIFTVVFALAIVVAAAVGLYFSPTL